jgi:hypothetical protein
MDAKLEAMEESFTHQHPSSSINASGRSDKTRFQTTSKLFMRNGSFRFSLVSVVAMKVIIKTIDIFDSCLDRWSREQHLPLSLGKKEKIIQEILSGLKKGTKDEKLIVNSMEVI